MSALVVACGDDNDDGGGIGGTGGSAGATGGTGGGGAAGSGNGGTDNGGTAGGNNGGTGGSGNGGTGATGGTGSDPDAGDAGGDTGFLEVRVTVTDELQLPGFNIDLGAGFDFSEGTITFRIRAEAYGDTVGVAPFVNDANFNFLGGSFTNLNTTNGFGTDNFVPVSFDLSPVPAEPDAGPTDFDKSNLRVVGIQIGTGGGFVGVDADAGADAGGQDIVVFIDSITFTDVDGVNNFEFTTGAEGFVLNPNFGFTDAVVIPH